MTKLLLFGSCGGKRFANLIVVGGDIILYVSNAMYRVDNMGVVQGCSACYVIVYTMKYVNAN